MDHGDGSRRSASSRGVRFALLLAVAGLASAGCSGDETSNAGGSTARQPSQLCIDMCGVVERCKSTADIGACRTHCQKELDGEGFLIPEIAEDYFEIMVTDPFRGDACAYAQSGLAWFHWGHGFDYTTLEDQAALRECTDVLRGCNSMYGGEGTDCFFGYYRYNVPLREERKDCLTHDCFAKSDGWRDDPTFCLMGRIIKDEPWVAGIEYVEPSLFPK